MSIGHFPAQNLPGAVTIHEQKQWSSIASRRANRQYRIWSDSALGHVDSRGGSRRNLRAAVDQRADRFFIQNIPTPPLHQAPPIASHHGRVWVYVQGNVGVRFPLQKTIGIGISRQ